MNWNETNRQGDWSGGLLQTKTLTRGINLTLSNGHF